MTKSDLSEYRSKMAEIAELEDKLKGLGDGSMTESSVINDYRTGYPRPQAVVGISWEDVAETEKRIEKLKKDCKKIEEYIEQIPDSVTRRIFRLYFLEGMKQNAVALTVHIERSGVSKKIDGYIKNHTNHKNHIYNKH